MSIKFYEFFNVSMGGLQWVGLLIRGGLQQIYGGISSKCVEKFLKQDDTSKETIVI